MLLALVLGLGWFWFRQRRTTRISGHSPSAEATEVCAGDKPGVLTRLTRIHEGPPPDQLEFEIVDQVVLGSDPAVSHLVFENDREIASKHCRMFLEGGRLYLQDLASPQGTFLNGVELTSKQCIEEQDILKIGRTEMRITFPR
jgi:hypothetical protein